MRLKNDITLTSLFLFVSTPSQKHIDRYQTMSTTLRQTDRKRLAILQAAIAEFRSNGFGSDQHG